MANRASYILGFEAVVASALFGLSRSAVTAHAQVAALSGGVLIASLGSALLAIHGFSYYSVPDPVTSLRTAANARAAKVALLADYARAKVHNSSGVLRHRWYVTISSFLLIVGATTFITFIVF